MKIKAMSDLHFEFHRDNGKAFVKSLDNDCDVLVLAGDICTPHLFVNTFNMFCEKFKEVIYVAGNHCYYHSSFTKVMDDLLYLESRYENFHWLENSMTYVNEQRFVGCTLWYLKNPVGVWSDGEWIKDADQINLVAQDSRKFLEETVSENDIVVTHMLPSYMSVDPQFAGSPYNGFFVNDVEHVIKERQPKLWISGHTHCSYDYYIGKTRMICNPFGYSGKEENLRFNSKLVVVV
jgi:predicted phosphodiesterase